MIRHYNAFTDTLKIINKPEEIDLPDRFDRFFPSDANILIYSNIPKDNHQDPKKINSIANKNDTVLFDISTEACYIKTSKEIKEKVNNKLYFLQSGLDYRDDEDFIFHPGFYRYDFSNMKPFINRKYRYSSLSRLIGNRDQRLIFTYQLYKLGILERGLVSCGSGETEQGIDFMKSFIKTMQKDFLNNLPLLIDGYTDVKKVSNHNSINNPGSDATYNIILESSIDDQDSKMHPELNYYEGWNRHFFTEKSAKAFNCMQIPLIIGPYKYVQRLRDLGFDMFNDIVDHSYDDIKSNDARISMVADEVKRLTSDTNYNKVVTRYNNLKDRLEKNRVNIKTLHEKEYRDYHNRLFNIFEKSVNKVV